MNDHKTTSLHCLHRRLGAKMVPFAGYEMPLHYAPGILKEHLHTRAMAGLFDVSHMGQIRLRARSGDVDEAALALETLMPADLAGLAVGRQRYGVLTSVQGGVLDDLMVVRGADDLFLVVNAARRQHDTSHLRRHLDDKVMVDIIEDRALIALQGPHAEEVLAAIVPKVTEMRFMDHHVIDSAFGDLWISRSGYTGEDGFEISVHDTAAPAFAKALLADTRCLPVGLGARDTLRLEAGLCLYGHDLDETTSPVAAGLGWSIQKSRRPGGARAGGFPGAEHIFHELADGVETRRVGLRAQGRAPVREGTRLYRVEGEEAPVGHVTSGAFGPSVGGPVAMGYVATEYAAPGTGLFADLRGRRVGVDVVALPFVQPGFKR